MQIVTKALIAHHFAGKTERRKEKYTIVNQLFPSLRLPGYCNILGRLVIVIRQFSLDLFHLDYIVGFACRGRNIH